MEDDFDEQAFYRALEKFVDSAKRSADALRRLQSAFAVFGYEVREIVDAHPKNISRDTSAKEIGEASVARASRKTAQCKP